MIHESPVAATVPERQSGARKEVSVKGTALTPRRKQQRVAGEDRHRLIAEAAYFRAEQRGFVPGRELEDWLEAELEINALLDDDDGRA